MRKAILLSLLVLAAAGCRRGRGSPPPVIAALPDFRLVDQWGKPFGLAELRGKPFVADFVFLGCSEVCPRLTERMRTLQGKARLVTFSVDPTNDTPERLQAYGKAFGADFASWTFLTGKDEDVERTVVRGFKIAMGKEEQGGILTIFHGEHFVLVDGEGRIRGYYVSDEEGLRKLLSDLQFLL